MGYFKSIIYLHLFLVPIEMFMVFTVLWYLFCLSFEQISLQYDV